MVAVAFTPATNQSGNNSSKERSQNSPFGGAEIYSPVQKDPNKKKHDAARPAIKGLRSEESEESEEPCESATSMRIIATFSQIKYSTIDSKLCVPTLIIEEH